LHVQSVIYSRLVADGDVSFVGGTGSDPVFAVMADAVEAPSGDPVEVLRTTVNG